MFYEAVCVGMDFSGNVNADYFFQQPPPTPAVSGDAYLFVLLRVTALRALHIELNSSSLNLLNCWKSWSTFYLLFCIFSFFEASNPGQTDKPRPKKRQAKSPKTGLAAQVIAFLELYTLCVSSTSFYATIKNNIYQRIF